MISLDALPSAAAVIDPVGRLRAANEAMARTFEAGPGELVGREAASLFPDQVDAWPLLSGGPARTIRVQGRRDSRVPFTADIEISPLPDGDTLWLLRELRGDRLMSEAPRYMDGAFDRSPIGMALLDTDGRFVRANTAFGRLLGHAPADLIGRRDQELTHPDDRRADVEAAWRVLNAEIDALQTEKRFVAADGSVVWVIANMSFLRDEAGRPITWLGQFQDITERKRTEEAVERFAAEQASLRRIATVVASEEAMPEELFALVAEEAGRLVGADLVGVMCFENEGRCALIKGLSGGLFDGARSPMGVGESIQLDPDSASGQVARSGRPMRIDRLGPTMATLLDDREGRNAAVAAPVRVDGRVWGAVSVLGRRESLPPGTEGRLGAFCELVGMALASADARAELARMASQDMLTGLPNRHVFNERLAHESQRAHRHGRPLALIVLDLDHFKRVNDTMGHQAGDEVLVEATRRLAELPRTGETMARVGGEEFAWILPETDGAGALAAAERARAAIAAEPFPHLGAMTLSAGYCAEGDLTSPEELFRRADLALYRAKRLGRNATCAYTPEETAG